MDRSEIDSWEIALAAGKHVRVGKAFAFVEPAALDVAPLAWLRETLAATPAARRRVVSLLGPEPAHLPGASLRPVDLPALRLGVVTSDKALYREGRDVAHLLAVDPSRPLGEVTVEVTLHGAETTRRPVRLDAAGAAALALRDLPAGDYEARLEGSDGDPACAFSVAEYRLSPLVAALVDRRLEGKELAGTLRLDTFGTPVDGPVNLELLDRGRRVTRVTAESRDGLLAFRLPLEGDGPHALSVQLAADPSRTASVPLTGSRKAEREATALSRLGNEVTASLLPSEGSREVRGLHLVDGAVVSTPFRVEGVGTASPRLVACGEAEAVRLVFVDPATARGRVVEERAVERMRPGEEVPLRLTGPLTLVAVGAFVGRSPWEGWAVLVSPPAVSPRVVVADRSRPGAEVKVAVELDAAAPADGGSGSVHLVVKDARLLTGDRPSSRLAGQLKSFAAAAGDALAVQWPDRTLADLAEDLRPMLPAGAPRGGFEAEPPPGFVAAPHPRSPFREDLETTGSWADAVPEAEPDPHSIGEEMACEKRRTTTVDEPDVLFAGLLPLLAGRAEITLRLPDTFADYAVEAFVVSRGDWGTADARFRTEKETFASLDLPPFVHPADAAEGLLRAGCASGRMRVRLRRDGLPATLRAAGRPLPDDEVLAARRADLSFLAEPGMFEATVEDIGSGAVETVRGRVEEPGRFRRLARTLRLLSAGETVTRDGAPGIAALRVLPGVDTSFGLLLEATADYGHACCEQTAAKMLAAVAMYAFAGEDGARRSRAEEVILAGLRREESMFLPGRGFKMYPELPPDPDPCWGPRAALHLFHLAHLRPLAPGPALAAAVARGLELAADASRAYGLRFPPEEPRTPDEAYAALRFGGSVRAGALALDVARTYAEGALPALGTASGKGAVPTRRDTAFAAASLLAHGDPADRRTAMALAIAVLKDLNDRGRLYSTVDSVAAIALLSEVRLAGLGSNGSVTVRLASGGERTLPAGEAASLAAEEVVAVTAASGTASVEVTRSVEESWGAFATTLTASFALERAGQPVRHVRTGDAVDLVVRLDGGYAPGDLLWVCLPGALTRVVGGGQVKLFAVDFRGTGEVAVPLAVTSPTVDRIGATAPQRFVACVRNMFEEERAACPGFLEVTATR